MADKAFIIQETQKYLAKGQIDKAIGEWENFLQSSPDANSFNTLGDLYLKKNNQQAAIEKFHRAAEIFRKEGFSLKALALYKKILNITPADAKSLYALGELSEEKNIAADAVKYYLSAGNIFMKEGRKTDAVRTYTKMMRLNSDNLPLRKQIAEVYSKEGFVEEVSYEYVEIARLLENRGETDEAMSYLERAVEIKPTNRAALIAIVSLFEKLGEKEKALDALKLTITRTGKSDDFLIWQARLCLHTGRSEEARMYAGELLQTDPDRLEAKRVLADTCLKEGDMKGAWAQYAPVLDEIIFKGQFDEARSILDIFMEAEPIQARKVLISLYKQKNDDACALGELKALGGLLKASGDIRGASACFNEALSISPGDEQLAGMLRDLETGEDGVEEKRPATEEPRQTAPVEEASEIKETEEAEEEENDGRESFQKLMAQADGLLASGHIEDAREVLESLKLKVPGAVGLHIKLKTVYLAANDKEQAVTECIILAELYLRLGDEAKRNEVINEAFEINPSDARLPERFGRREDFYRPEGETGPVAAHLESAVSNRVPAQNQPDQAEKDPVQLDGAEVAEKLSEAAFYLDQGLYEEAEKIYNELHSHFPDNASISARLEEVELLKARPDDQAVGAAANGQNKNPVFADASEEALEGDVGRIFDEFKKGVEKQLDPGDAETRYNLGIAYTEMGLLDDAIREFQAVLNDPVYGIKAVSFLANCYMEKGLYPSAAEALMTVLKSMGPEHDAYWGLKYALAQAREKNSEPKEALELYMEVSNWNSGFREVAARIAALGGTAPAASGKKAAARKDRISYI